MPDLSRTLIIVPVYNETEAVLLPALRDLQQTGARIVVVDDGSDEPISLAASFRGLTLLRHPVNLGQGAALQTGMEYARRRADVDYVVHFDGDGQHPIDALPSLLEPLAAGQADIVLGSRFLKTTDRRMVPASRRLVLQGGRIFNFLVTGIWMTDAHIGLRALHRRAFGVIHLRENRMAYATELLWQIRTNRLRWHEVPVAVTYSTYSRAKGQSSWNALRIAGDVLLRLIYP